MEYAIYLHTNGTLIHKPKIVYENDNSYFDSPFVKEVWYVKPQEWKIGDYIKMLEEAKELGASQESLKEYMDTWAIDERVFFDREDL